MNKSFTESDSKVIEYALKHPTDESVIALKTHDKMFRTAWIWLFINIILTITACIFSKGFTNTSEKIYLILSLVFFCIAIINIIIYPIYYFRIAKNKGNKVWYDYKEFVLKLLNKKK